MLIIDDDEPPRPQPRPRATTTTAPLQKPCEHTFPDVAGNVHEEAICEIAAEDITKGYVDGRYGPDDPVTRGQMATFLVRAFSLQPHHDSVKFPDVPSANVHSSNIYAVIAAGIARGYVDGRFGPDDPVTRGQMATFLARALNLVEN